MNPAAFALSVDAARPWGVRGALRGALSNQRAAVAAAVPVVHDLAAGELLSTRLGSLRSVECLRGSVWLTIDNDPRDVVLKAGESFHAKPTDRVIVQALAAARVRCLAERG